MPKKSELGLVMPEVFGEKSNDQEIYFLLLHITKHAYEVIKIKEKTILQKQKKQLVMKRILTYI